VKQVLSILLQNQPDALVRLVGVVYRRGFAVESLSVTQAAQPNCALVTAVVSESQPESTQLLNQIRKLVHVINAEMLPSDTVIPLITTVPKSTHCPLPASLAVPIGHTMLR